jgi:hypothetical protein
VNVVDQSIMLIDDDGRESRSLFLSEVSIGRNAVGDKCRLEWRLTIEFPMGIINNQPNLEDKKIWYKGSKPYRSQSWEVRETMSLGYPKLMVI